MGGRLGGAEVSEAQDGLDGLVELSLGGCDCCCGSGEMPLSEEFATPVAKDLV